MLASTFRFGASAVQHNRKPPFTAPHGQDVFGTYELGEIATDIPSRNIIRHSTSEHTHIEKLLFDVRTQPKNFFSGILDAASGATCALDNRLNIILPQVMFQSELS